MKISVAYENIKYSNPICYTFSVIFETLGLDYEILPGKECSKGKDCDLGIYYGRKGLAVSQHKNICIAESQLYRNFLRIESYPSLPLKSFKEMPLIYCQGNPLSINKDTAVLGFDLIASIFFMLSRYEEKLFYKFDEHGRFMAKDSLAYKANFLHRPIVNEYIRFFGKLCEELVPGLKCREKEEKMRLFLSHDVDHLRMSLSEEAKGLICSISKRTGLGHACYRFLLALGAKLKLRGDPYSNLGEIIELEDKAGYRSTFFIAGERGAALDPRYDVTSLRISRTLKEIDRGGWGLGLHGSYDSMLCGRPLRRGKDTLERIAGGRIVANRQHYLRWRASVTPRLLEEAGLLFDFSVGYADAPGFRSGYCRPYRPFDISLNRVLEVCEVPLIAMDDTFCKYLKCSPAEAFDRIVALAETTNKYGGVFSLLWHNTFLSDDNSAWRDIYCKLLEYFSRKKWACITVRDLEKYLPGNNQEGVPERTAVGV